MTDELTPEESAAIEEMTSEPELDLEEEQPEEPVEAAEEQPEEQEEKPEFKTTREKPPEGYVPHQAMHEERLRRQEAERRLAALEQAAEQQRKAAEQAKAEEEAKLGDPLVDPDGFQKNLQRQLESTREMVRQQQQAAQRERLSQARAEDAVRMENEFKATVPDYDDAVRHINEARVEELRAYGMDDQRIIAQIAQDANSVYDSAKRLGMNPAQLLYQLAQQRGYKPRPKVDEAAAQVEALATAQKQTQGLGSGGSRQAGRLTVSQIAEMSEAEVAKLSPDEIARAFGG